VNCRCSDFCDSGAALAAAGAALAAGSYYALVLK